MAKQELLGLSPTVTELFLKVREQLFHDGKELVLLVEDFAVLSGLQGQLLQVMIEGAYRDGRQVLCTMRVALAYTPGYMQTATVLTRLTTDDTVVRGLALSPDGRVLAAWGGRELRLWDLAVGRMHATLPTGSVTDAGR